MTELTKEQSEKADYFLEIVCNSGDTAIDSKVAYDLFSSRDETLYVCSVLEKLSLIDIISPTEGDPIYMILCTVNTCHFLEEGGFLRKNKKNENKHIVQPIHQKAKLHRITSFIEKFWWKILAPIIVTSIIVLVKKGIINI